MKISVGKRLIIFLILFTFVTVSFSLKELYPQNVNENYLTITVNPIVINSSITFSIKVSGSDPYSFAINSTSCLNSTHLFGFKLITLPLAQDNQTAQYCFNFWSQGIKNHYFVGGYLNNIAYCTPGFLMSNEVQNMTLPLNSTNLINGNLSLAPGYYAYIMGNYSIYSSHKTNVNFILNEQILYIT